MSVDYIVASLPALRFDESAPLTWEKFCAAVGGEAAARGIVARPEWVDLETQLRNAMAVARGGAQYARPTSGLSLYWQKRVQDCFAEKNVMARETAIDRVWWDAAGELTPPSAPLGRGALATYAVRLQIALKREKIAQDKGNAAFDRLTASTNLSKK